MSALTLGAIIAVLIVARLILWIAPAAVPEEHHRNVAREYLDAFIIAGVVALVLMKFVVRTFWIPSGSMEPTLEINDVLLANEIEYRLGGPKDGEIAVFSPPAELGDTDFIKRVMAVPGDRFRIHNGMAYRNGQPLKEPFIKHDPMRPLYELDIKKYGVYVDGTPLDPVHALIPPKEQWQAPDRIPNGYYLMLGDNRNDSDDSHLWGFLRRDQFVGHAFFVFWPPKHMKVLH